MRLFTASVATETNTFSPIPTSIANFYESFYAGPGEHPDEPKLCTAPLWVARRRAREEVVAVDPAGSIYAYYKQHGKMPPPEEQSNYLIDGIGGSIKAASAWLEYVDEVITIDDKTAYQATLELARTEAIFGGSSSGAAAAGARQVAEALPEDALVVTLFPDSGERYLSRLNEEWMRERGLLDETGSDASQKDE